MDATVSTKKLDAVGEFEVAIEFASMVQIKYIILHDASTWRFLLFEQGQSSRSEKKRRERICSPVKL
jgi:hypothetical protein